LKRFSLTFFCTVLLWVHFCDAQSHKLAIYKTFGGVVYEMDTLSISTQQVAMVLKSNPDAYREFELARTNATASSVLGFSGAALVAVPLVTLVANGEANWLLAGGGAALLLASIPFNLSFKNHAANAIELYNGKLTSQTRLKSTLYLTGSSATILIRF
jgi:hypothetical protein